MGNFTTNELLPSFLEIKFKIFFKNFAIFSHSLLSIILFLSSFNKASSFRLQGAAVKGQLLCKGIPAAHLNVGLFDVDRNPGDPDDLLDKGVTDKYGNFALDGTTRELLSIEPELRIIHDCDDGLKVFMRVNKLYIPT